MADKDNSPVEHEPDRSRGENYETRGKPPLVTDEDDPSILVRTEVHQGSRLGDVRVRLVRPAQQMFRRLDAGLLEATAAADVPRTPLERAVTSVKRVLIGVPLATARAEHERLTKFKALAVLS